MKTKYGLILSVGLIVGVILSVVFYFGFIFYLSKNDAGGKVIKPKRKYKVVQFYSKIAYYIYENTLYCDSVKTFTKSHVRVYLDGTATDLIAERILVTTNE